MHSLDNIITLVKQLYIISNFLLYILLFMSLIVCLLILFSTECSQILVTRLNRSLRSLKCKLFRGIIIELMAL